MIFISWSGERSKQLGLAIRQWLRRVLQSVEPYFTEVDIDKGAAWHTEIAEALKKSNVGLIILTQDNLTSPWIMFEAGAIARSVERPRVCPILFGIRTADLSGPLSLFQAAEFSEEGLRSVVSTINKTMQKPLDEAALADTFEMWWPKLKTEVETIMATYKSAAAVSPRKDRELLEEILGLARAGSSMLTGIDYTLRRLGDQPVLIPTARMLEALFAIDQDTLKRIASTHDLKPPPWLQFQLPPSPKADSESDNS